MTTAQGFVPADGGFYFAIQTAKGTPSTTFKGGLGVTDIDWEPVKSTIRGVPMQGAGIFRQQQVGTGALVNWSAKGWGSLDQLPAFFMAGNGVKGTTTALATTGFSTPFTMNAKNSTKQYMTLAYVVGESAAGTGIKRSVLRDAVAGNKTFRIVSKEAFTWEASGMAINEGPGAASTFSFNSAFNIPDIANPANVLTYPSFVPAGFCSTSIVLAFSCDLTPGPNCIGTVEPSDIYIDNASWKITGQAQGDANFATFYNQVNYGTDTPTADTSQMSAALKQGALSFTLVSDTIIASSSPATPYSIGFNFPSVQYTKAKFTQGTPVMGDWEAETFGSDAVVTANNATSSAGMTL